MPVIDNLIALWSLDESSGNAIDAQGTNTLTDNGGITSAAGAGADTGTSRDFAYLSSQFFGHASNSDLSTGDIEYSFAGWFYIRAVTAGVQAIVSKDDTGQQEFKIDWASGNIRYRTNNGAFDSVQVAAASTVTWYFFACGQRIQGGGKELWISVDNGSRVTDTVDVPATTQSSEFRLGAVAQIGFEEFLDGRLDEIGFWKRALSDDDLTFLYNAAAGRSYADIVAEAGGGGNPASYYQQLRRQAT